MVVVRLLCFICYIVGQTLFCKMSAIVTICVTSSQIMWVSVKGLLEERNSDVSVYLKARIKWRVFHKQYIKHWL